MSRTVYIRQAKPTDAVIFAALNREFNDRDMASGVIESRLLTDPNSEIVLIGEIEGTAVGFACVRVMSSVCYPHPWAELTELYVRSGYRRRGVGRALVQEAERLAQKQGATEVHLYTGDGNLVGKTFYRALGYTERSSEVLFQKQLRPKDQKKRWDTNEDGR